MIFILASELGYNQAFTKYHNGGIFCFMSNYTGGEAFANFIAGLRDQIQSPEALSIEAQYRLDRLLGLIQGGEWTQDEKGNVFPASLPLLEQRQITDKSAYSIIDEIPKIVEGHPSEVDFSAIGSLVSGVTIIVNYPNTPVVTLQFNESQIIDTELTVGEPALRS